MVTGVGGGRFAPDQIVTRQDFAVMLCRYQALIAGQPPAATGNLSRFTDGDSAAAYAVVPLSWCIEQGILNSRTSTTLVPQGQALRSETAAMLYRFMHGMPAANSAD